MQSIKIVAVVSLLLVLLRVGNSANFIGKTGRERYLSKASIASSKPFFMDRSRNLTNTDRINLMDRCKGIGGKCHLAEECCSLQCVMPYGECVNY